MRDGNFKVRCTRVLSPMYDTLYTKGKEYNIVNGILTMDNGDTISRFFYDVIGLNFFLSAQFELVKDPKSNTIVIFRKGNDVVASLKEGKETIKTEKARCCPDDKFDFNTGAKIAFDRLLEIKDKEVKDSVKIVKQDTYKVGDKVKFVSERPDSWNSSGLMDKYLGKVVEITKWDNYNRGCFKFSGSEYWDFGFDSIQGKIQNYDLSKVSDEDLIAEITKRIKKK